MNKRSLAYSLSALQYSTTKAIVDRLKIAMGSESMLARLNHYTSSRVEHSHAYLNSTRIRDLKNLVLLLVFLMTGFARQTAIYS